jgi:hypothetical protein
MPKQIPLHWRFLLVSLLFAGSFANQVNAAPKKHRIKSIQSTQERINFIEQKLIHLRMGLWGLQLKQGESKYTVGLGLSPRLRAMFFEDRHSTKFFDQYRAFSIAGLVTTGVGLLGSVSGTAWLLLAGMSNGMSSGAITGPLVMVAISLVVMMIGPFLLIAGHNRLMKAIDIYNQGVFSRARRGQWKISFQWTPGGAMGACANVRF